MHKTTVYLNDEEVEALRRLAASTGRSQAELIREAIRQATGPSRAPRQFRSLGKGQGPGGPTPRWNAAELYEKRLSVLRED
jgi:Arc/MetJ-type ribon-helix-helix transcriptional regulator